MESFKNKDGRIIVDDMIKAIQDNKDYLSKVDGAIGDGDHGINMNKGFTLCAERLDDTDSLSKAMYTLGEVLFSEIGGSMGPLYGTFFMDMASSIENSPDIGAEQFEGMLNAAVEGISDLVDARVGDKTLMDALIPARDAFVSARAEGRSFTEALKICKEAAEKGRDYTIDLVAKFGRASRLGERSRGVLDAGATSCALLIGTITTSIVKMLE